jgi:hypothetical protein
MYLAESELHKHNWIFAKRRFYKLCTIEYFYCYCRLLWNQILPPLKSKPQKASLEDLKRMIGDKNKVVVKPEVN